MTGGFLRLEETDKGDGGAKERGAGRAPSTSRDVILNLPSGFAPAALTEERWKYEEGQDGPVSCPGVLLASERRYGPTFWPITDTVRPFSRFRFRLFFFFRCLEGLIKPPWNSRHFQAIISNKSRATFPRSSYLRQNPN